MNSNLIFTTNGSGDSYKRSGFISGGIFMAIGFFLMMAPLFAGFKEKGILVVAFIGIIPFIWGAIELSVKRNQGNTYVEFYDTFIQGSAIHGQRIDQFYFENDKISSITVGNYTRTVMTINIMTVAGEYKVITNKETADKVYSYIRTIKFGK